MTGTTTGNTAGNKTATRNRTMTMIHPGSPALPFARLADRSRFNVQRMAIAFAATVGIPSLVGGCAVVTIAGAAASYLCLDSKAKTNKTLAGETLR